MSLYKFQDAEGLKTRLVTLAIDTCIVALRDLLHQPTRQVTFLGGIIGVKFYSE